MTSDVEASYSHRAAEYTQHLGSMTSVHPSDVQLVTSWAAHVDGPLLDAGCGPGHWTGYLAETGRDARGVDQVPIFIAHASRTFPQVPFAVGSIDALPDASDSIGGILAWYSLIHHEPSTIHRALNEFARVLRPGGKLLVGFFVGPEVEAFEHAIVTAYHWSVESLIFEIREAGFEVFETHTRTGLHSGPRPHGAIVAELAKGG
jgi:SAM-dependent methyltransferase